MTNLAGILTDAQAARGDALYESGDALYEIRPPAGIQPPAPAQAPGRPGAGPTAREQG
jgi:hypothetical protein